MTLRSSALAASLLLAALGCAGPSPAGPAAAPVSSSPAAASTTAAPAASAALVPAASASVAAASSAPLGAGQTAPPPEDPDLARMPLATAAQLAALSPGQRDRLDAFARVCAPAIGQSEGKIDVGCYRCPSSYSSADRRPRALGKDDPFLPPFSDVSGSFSGPGLQERLLFFSTCTCNGCEDEAFLLRQGEKGLERVSSSLVGSSSDCKPVRSRGRPDRVACMRHQATQGVVVDTVNVYDFSLPPEDARARAVVEFSALDATQGCDVGLFFLEHHLVKWEVRDENRDGDDDLVLQVSFRGRRLSPALVNACLTLGPERWPSSPLLPRPTRARLTWLSSGASLTPDEPTVKLLAQLEAHRKQRSGD